MTTRRCNSCGAPNQGHVCVYCVYCGDTVAVDFLDLPGTEDMDRLLAKQKPHTMDAREVALDSVKYCSLTTASIARMRRDGMWPKILDKPPPAPPMGFVRR